MRRRSAYPWAGLGLTVVLLLVGSCDRQARHEVLTLFFDGVPPLEGETPQSTIADANAALAAGSQTGGWFVHEPLKDCTLCHANRRQRAFSREVQLIADVPQLCHRCHEQDTADGGWVHGPVATGQCLLCHEPHKTRVKFLLSKPVPGLCYNCHDPQAIRTIEHHAEASYEHCLTCHEGHVGATRTLLRPSFLQQPAGRSYRLELQQRQYRETLESARDELTRSGDFLPLLLSAINHLEGGRYGVARAYLETSLESDALTAVERATITDALRQVTALQEVEATGDSQKALVTALRAIREDRSRQQGQVAERYYESIRQYHAGRVAEAREGFRAVLADPSTPGPIRKTAETYVRRIEQGVMDRIEPE